MTTLSDFSLDSRLARLVRTKIRNTTAKRDIYHSLDFDDHGSVLMPEPAEFRPTPNSESDGGCFGHACLGRNFGGMLRSLPAYIDPDSSLAGAWFIDPPPYRSGPGWPTAAEFSFQHLHADQKRYDIVSGIGGGQHFCPDLAIGFQLGWGGLLDKVRQYAAAPPTDADPGFYEGHEACILGIQAWITRHVRTARERAAIETDPGARRNLLEVADLNEWLVSGPPRTLREACQWIAWVAMVTRLFNGSGAIGQLDELLQPFYERDSQAGVLTDAEAVFHLACMFLIDTQYYQIGGPSADGQDRTSPISFLILEALHQARIPSNVTVRVWDGLDPELFDRAVDYLCRDRNGSPRFMGEDGMTEGFMRNGYPRALARERVTCGCHWAAIPGREYTLNDIVKINFGAVFTAALQDLRRLPADAWTTPQLWDLYCEHLEQGIACVKQGIDHHLRLMYRVTPEIPLNLLCHGTIERGRDVTHGGVDHYNMCIDGAALATVADSFAALETFVEREGTLTWPRMFELLDTDFRDDEPTRQMLRNMPRFGHGGSAADRYAERLVERFVHEVKKGPTPDGFNCIPGLFSWANTVPMGRVLPATPNGRHAGAPISHGANPDPGFRRDGAATALFNALLQVQCRWGNTVPIQVELDPGMARPGETRERLKALIQTYCRQGGTLLNINILNRDQVLEAHRDPDTHPDLVVRVTGFSAYFRLLSPEFRQLVVDRIMAE